MNLALGTAMLMVLVIVEAVGIRITTQEKIPWREWVFNVNSGHILMWMGRAVELYVFAQVSLYFSVPFFDFLPLWGAIPLFFVMWDFCFYVLHYTHHKFKPFWWVHRVHHEGEHFSLSLGIRNSWYSSISSIPFFLILAFLGCPFEYFLSISAIHYFIQFYNHNHLVINTPVLDWFMVTPKHHRVHHGKDEPYIDKNFGGTFLWWDKIFGTFQKEDKDSPLEFGIHGAVNSHQPLIANHWPLVDERVEVESTEEAGRYQFSGTVVLFTCLIAYIYYEQAMGWDLKMGMFTMVFLGTLLNTYLDLHKLWSVLLWFFMPLIFFTFAYNLVGSKLWLMVSMSLWLGHAFFSLSYILLIKKTSK